MFSASRCFQCLSIISLDNDIIDSYAIELFLRTMPQAIGRQVIVYQPYTKTITWDERCIISLIEAVTRADFDSVYFMINSVVQKKYRREAMQIVSSMRKISA